MNHTREDVLLVDSGELSATRGAEGDAFEALVQAVEATDANVKLNPNLFSAAVGAARNRLESSEELLGKMMVSPVDAKRWAVLELHFHKEVQDPTKPPDVTTDEPMEAVAKALARSIQISGRKWRRSPDTMSESLPDHPRVDRHRTLFETVLQADSNGFWIPCADGFAEAISGLPWNMLERFAEAGAPLATELVTRKEVLELGRAARDWPSKEIRARKRGLRTIGRVLRGTGGGPISGPEWKFRLRIAAYIGRLPDVWHAVESARKELLTHPPEHGDALKNWAILVSLSWATTAEALDLVSALPTAALVALAGTDTAGHALLRRVRSSLEERATRDSLSESDWTSMQRVGATDAEFFALLASARSRAIDPVRLAREAAKDEGYRLAQLARNNDPEYLLSDAWRSAVVASAPGAALFALAIVVPHVRRMIRERQRLFLTAAADRARTSVEEIREARSHWATLVGAGAPRIEEACNRVERALNTAGADLAAARAGLVDDEPARLVLPSAVEPVLNLTSILVQLAFDGRRSPAATRTARENARSALAWALADEARLTPVMSASLETFPAEAHAVIWETGLLLDSPMLLARVEEAIGRFAWAAETWADILVAVVETMQVPPVLEQSLAERSIGLLQQRVQELANSAQHVDVAGVVGQQQAKIALVGEHGRAVVSEFMNALERLSKSLTTELTHGVTAWH